HVYPRAVGVQHRGVEGLAVAVSELEDVPDLDRALHVERPATGDARLAGDHLTDVDPAGRGQVTVHVDAAQVHVVGVGPGEHVAAAAQLLVDEDRQAGHADPAETA